MGFDGQGSGGEAIGAGGEGDVAGGTGGTDDNNGAAVKGTSLISLIGLVAV